MGGRCLYGTSDCDQRRFVQNFLLIFGGSWQEDLDANGSAINGLASSYQNKMTADGYTVTGVGNYTGIKQTSTTIYAKKTEWGKPLLNYYKNAAIKSKSELSQNPDWQSADIVVVLGTDAALE